MSFFVVGEAGSVTIAVGVQSARVWVMCGRAGSCACTTGVLSPPRVIEAKVSRLSMRWWLSFWRKSTDDPTTKVRGRRALAIAKPTARDY